MKRRRGGEACRWNNPGISEIPGLFHNAGVAVGAGLDAPRNVPPGVAAALRGLSAGSLLGLRLLDGLPGASSPSRTSHQNQDQSLPRRGLEEFWGSRGFKDIERAP